MNEGPRRWVDSGEDPALSDALQGAPRPRSRSDVERERTAHRVARISLGLGAVGAAWGAGKTVALAAALLGVTAATVTLATRTTRTTSAPSAPSAPSARPPRASASSRPAPVASATESVEPSALVPASAQSLPAAPSARRAAPATEPRVRNAPAVEPAPAAHAVAEPSAGVLPANIPAVAPEVASDVPPSGGLTREVALLHEASAALDRSPAEALAVCDRHAREFPTGALEDERELLAVQALTRMGSLERALSRGEAFLARRPSSVHAARMRRVLASPTP